MSADLFQVILGVPEDSEPRVLLGLGSRKVDAASIEAALRHRIMTTYAHPEGRGDEAEEVRKRLRRVARTLLRSLKPAEPEEPTWPPMKTRARHPVSRLTDFDRHVLAVLVGCGGWNASARSRLVAVAAVYGVSVGGLFKVVQGLSEYGKSGGAPLGLDQITAGGVGFKPLVPPTRKEPDPTWLTRVAPELMESTLRSTFRLSLLFGSITVLLGLIAVRVLFVSESRPGTQVTPPSQRREGPRRPRPASLRRFPSSRPSPVTP
jgi:hypothetical protein